MLKANLPSYVRDKMNPDLRAGITRKRGETACQRHWDWKSNLEER
jgi:hypothetical protein